MDKCGFIDFSLLERELHKAVEADKKYQRENDAKFRAIHQKVSSYAEFRDIVQASHLKPLERKDKEDRKQPWNSLAFAHKEQQGASSETEQTLLPESDPSSVSEFIRSWSRFRGASAEQYSFVTRLGGPKLREIFSIEVGFGLLGDFLVVLSQCLRSGDEDKVIGVLEGLAQTGRFRLNLSLLSTEERGACECLLQKLQPEESGVWTLCPLLFAYQAPEDKEDIFTTRSCPAFLIFESAAYLSDMTIELPCQCKPADALSVVWYYQKHLGTTVRVLTDFSGNSVVDASKVGRNVDLRGRFSIRLFSLVMFRVQPGDSGHYICGTQSGEFFYGYDLDVQVVRNILFGPNLAPRNTEGDQLFRTFITYWPWSRCDRCDVQGEQVRIGLCQVTSRHLQVRYLNELRNATSCGSSSVPARFGLKSEIYGAELSVRPCQAFCPPKKIRNYPKHLGDFLGIGDPAAPRLPVHYHSHPTESDLVLSCPGARPEHAVAWDKESTALYRSEYMEGLKENSRVFIDAGHHLHFRPVRLVDKGTYYCWLQGTKAAEIRLGVYSRLGQQRKLSDPESLFALGVIFSFYGVIIGLFLLIISVRCIWMYRKEGRALY